MADGYTGPRHGPLYDMGALGFAPGEAVCVTGAASGIGKACALAAAKAGLAVTIDVGDRYDIHPSNKQEVGRR